MTAFQYPNLSNYAREKMMARAMKVLEAQQQLMAWGGPHAFMLEHSGHVGSEGEDISMVQGGYVSDWHYPKGDRIDFDGGSQYFYHCHRENMDTEEHGHFHTFIRKPGWPKSYALKQIPERTKYLDNPMTHLVTVALNRHGIPIRLFMVNRWVTKESWFGAEKMQHLVKRFDLSCVKNERPKTGNQDAKWQVMDQWVENLVHLFVPQIQWLYEERDIAMTRYVEKGAFASNPYLDESIEELASINISLEQQVGWLTGPSINEAA